MNDIYAQLNDYLNEICKYLEKDHSFFLSHIYTIAYYNDIFLTRLEKYPINHEVVSNKLTYQDVYLLAREIIAHIDKYYLIFFDKLMASGELDFSYEQNYLDSQCISIFKKDYTQQLININRSFNYNDVRVLVHEFMHYTNGLQYFANRQFFTEFFSIYFEFYAIDYLISKGIDKREIDYYHRIRSVKEHSNSLMGYEIVLLSFFKFGFIHENTYSLLNQYFLNMDKDSFDNECRLLFHQLRRIDQENEEIGKDRLGYILSSKFITQNYRYVLGTILAIYAWKYSKFSDVVFLNNHLHEFDHLKVEEICLKIGIDLNSSSFKENFFLALDEYMNHLQEITEKKR